MSLHDPHNEVAFAVLVLVVDHLPLGFTYPLDDDLFGRLCGDPSKLANIHLHREANLVAEGCLWVLLLGLLEGALERRLLHFLGDLFDDGQADVPGFQVDVGVDVFELAEELARG